MTGVFAESTYLMAGRDKSWGTTVDHLVMKPSGIGSSRIVYTTETGWEVIDILVDSRGCVLLFEINWHDEAARLRVLSFRTTSTKTRDLGDIHPEYQVCVQTT